MRLFGLTVSRAPAVATTEKAIASVPSGGGWWPVIRESFPGAWQRNVTVDQGAVLSFHAVWACATLIASDVAKLRVKLVQQDAGGVWSETASPAYSPVLRKPNAAQNRIQFWEHWMLSGSILCQDHETSDVKTGKRNDVILSSQEIHREIKALKGHVANKEDTA